MLGAASHQGVRADQVDLARTHDPHLPDVGASAFAHKAGLPVNVGSSTSIVEASWLALAISLEYVLLGDRPGPAGYPGRRTLAGVSGAAASGASPAAAATCSASCSAEANPQLTDRARPSPSRTMVAGTVQI